MDGYAFAMMITVMPVGIAGLIWLAAGASVRSQSRLEQRHEVWKVNAMLLIEAAEKYRGPADSIEERQRDGRKLDWFIAQNRELMSE